MPASIVQSRSVFSGGANTSGFGVVLASTPTPGNLLVAFVTGFQGFTVGGAWTDSGITVNDANSGVNRILYRYVQPGDTDTFSFGVPANSSFWMADVVEITDVLGTWASDFGASQTGTASSATEPFATTSFNCLRDDALALVFVECPQAGSPATKFDGSWTDRAATTGGGYGGGVASKLVADAGDPVVATLTGWTRGFTTAYVALTIEPELPDPALARVSQQAMLVLAANFTDPHVSQHAMLVLATNKTIPRVSQHAMLVLGAGSPCITKRADLWRISRKDGVVLGFTGHNKPIAYGPITYTPCDSLTPSAIQQTADIESVSNMDLQGIISDDKISERDILAGLYDDAYVEVFRVSWNPAEASPDGGAVVDSVYRMHAGWVGQSSVGEKGYTMEVVGPGARLAQKTIVNIISPSCRFELGDADCGKDIADLILSGTLTAAADKGQFIANLTATTGGGQYDQGKVLWLTGPNAGTISKIKTVEFETGDTATVVLWTLTPFLPTAGDQIEIEPGCDKTAPTCKDVYDNFLEFGGYDKVPGNDAINNTPDAAY